MHRLRPSQRLESHFGQAHDGKWNGQLAIADNLMIRRKDPATPIISTEDQIAIYRSESIRASKRYGLLSSVIAIAVVFIAYGMPGHFLWPWLGVPLVFAFAFTFALFLFHGARLLYDWLEAIGK